MPKARIHYLIGDIVVGSTWENEAIFDYTNRKLICSTRYGCHKCGELWGSVIKKLLPKDLEIYRHAYVFCCRLCRNCGGGSFFNHHSNSDLAYILAAPVDVLIRELEIEFNG